MAEPFDPAQAYRIFYDTFNRAKEEFANRELQSCLLHLVLALKIRLTGQLMRREKKLMSQELFKFILKLSSSKLYIDAYGPVTFVENQEQQWLKYIVQLITVSKDAIASRVQKGEDLLNSGQTEEAREVLTKVMDDFDTNAEVAVEVGDQYMNHEMYDDAENAYRRAVVIDPDTVHIINRLAMSLRKDGRPTEAVKLYQKAIKLAPNDEGLYYNLALVLAGINRMEAALKIMRLGMEKNPTFEPGLKLIDFIEKKTHRK